MLMTNEIRVGTAFMYEGSPLIVQKLLGQKGGRQGMVTNLRVQNIVTGSTMQLGLDAGEKFEEVDLVKKTVKLSYIDGNEYHFMDQETYEDVPVNASDVGDNFKFVKENMECTILSYKGKVFSVEPPFFVELEVTETDPGFAGNTATNATKPATLETGAEIKVPLFIEVGEKLKIDTRTGEYLSRA